MKGHQDELLSASSLPHLTQLNILADQLAKQSILCLLQHHQRWVGLLVWSLQVNTQTVTSDPHPCIIQHLGYHAAYKYIVEKAAYLLYRICPDQLPCLGFSTEVSPYMGCDFLSLYLGTLPLGI